MDGAEINRFPGSELLWSLLPDAKQELVEFSIGPMVQRFVGRHHGYLRLTPSVTVERTIQLETGPHVLRVIDRVLGKGHHKVEVPLHLHPRVKVVAELPGRLDLEASGRAFELIWSGAGWTLEIGQGREAESYGCSRSLTRLAWRSAGELGALDLTIGPRGPRRES